MDTSSPRVFALAALAALLLADRPAARSLPMRGSGADAQLDAGFLAAVEDLKITSTYLAAENTTDVVLALVPPSPAGDAGITLMLKARYPGRTADPARLREIVIRAHYRLHSDDRPRSVNAIDRQSPLELALSVSGASGISLNFFPASWGYVGYSAPGDEIPVAWFTVSAAELRAMAFADGLSGRVLWTDFTMTDAQRDALRTFASRVLPPAARP